MNPSQRKAVVRKSRQTAHEGEKGLKKCGAWYWCFEQLMVGQRIVRFGVISGHSELFDFCGSLFAFLYYAPRNLQFQAIIPTVRSSIACNIALIVVVGGGVCHGVADGTAGTAKN